MVDVKVFIRAPVWYIGSVFANDSDSTGGAHQSHIEAHNVSKNMTHRLTR